jgi:branched-chain amino acid aminotransferase
MMGGRVVYFNGDYVPENEARLSIYDSALMFGDMVFEMTRSFNGKQFKLREHLERLYASARYVHIYMPITIDEMEKAAYETIERNGPAFEDGDEHRLMINVSRGLLSIYRDVVGGHKGTNVIIADFPLRWTVVGMGRLFDEGIDAVVPSQRAIPASLLEPKVKSRSRLHFLMANAEVADYKGQNAWALLLDPDGFITEGTGANFFIVKDDEVITPEPRNILRGISRAYVMEELCPRLGLRCVEKNIEPYDAFNADEAFFTGTPFCVLPVTKINGERLNSGAMGPVTKKLIDRWGENVGLDIIGQIKKWGLKTAREGAGPSPYRFKGKEG